jgi:Signal transduction histidine kinase
LVCIRDSNSINIGAVIVLNDITQLRNLENIRKQFVSNVSHELKTPITAIKGFVETLKNIDNNNQDQKKFLQIIESHSDRLNCIIDDLLNLSRIEEQSGKEKLNLKNQKLLPVIDQAVQGCDILIQDKSISVKVNCDKQISILQNSRLMQEALSNLISNAVKYSDNESEIIISVNQNNDKDIISIKDYGIGISEKHQERLFERFYRVDESRSRDQGGTGLGLSIVKHIVNFHNGSITVNSEVDKGSTFSIIIPK